MDLPLPGHPPHSKLIILITENIFIFNHDSYSNYFKYSSLNDVIVINDAKKNKTVRNIHVVKCSIIHPSSVLFILKAEVGNFYKNNF